MASLDCVTEHLIPHANTTANATRCQCQVFYRGTLCEERIPWFNTVHYARIAYSLFLTCIVLYWVFLKLIYEGKEGKLANRRRLSQVALYSLLVGCMVNLAHKMYKAVYFTSPAYWYSTGYVFLVKVALASIYIALYMVATNLILGFWFAVLTAKFRPKLALRTKLASMVGAVVELIFNPIGSILSQIGYGNGYVLMIVLPLLANAIMFVVMTSIIGCRVEKALTSDSKLHAKTLYSIRIFAVLSAFWMSYVLSIGVITVAYLIFPDRIALVEVSSGFYIDTLEFIVAICVMYLIDRHGGIRGLTLAFFANQEVSDSRDFTKSSNIHSSLNLNTSVSNAAATDSSTVHTYPEPLVTGRTASYKESSDTTEEVVAGTCRSVDGSTTSSSSSSCTGSTTKTSTQ